MKPATHIVEGGGWVTHQTMGKPKARACGFLSVAWLAVSLGASVPFWDGWPQAFGWLEWTCSALVLPLPILVALTLIFWRVEKPRAITEHRRNPDYDVRKLY